MRNYKQDFELFNLGLQIGIIAVPVFYILDYITYPGFRLETFSIRFLLEAYILLLILVIKRISPKHIITITTISYVLASWNISLICFVVGEGFTSRYIIGVVQIILIIAVIFDINIVAFTLTILSILLSIMN